VCNRVGRLCLGVALIALVSRANGQSVAPLPMSDSLANFDAVQTNIGKRLLLAAPQVRLEASQIRTFPVSARAKPESVSGGEKTVLLHQIAEFANHARSEEVLFTRLAIGFIAGAAFLALIGAILSFARQHIAAGIAGLVVTAVISFSNAYPLNALSDFYRGLAGQAAALQIDCELRQPFTVDFYNSAADQLKLLYLYEGSKRPSFANYRVPMQNLTEELQNVKTKSDAVERARAAMTQPAQDPRL